MADKITVVVKDAELVTFIERYAKQTGLENGAAVEKMLLTAKSRIAALVKYAKKVVADASAKAQPKAKAPPKAKAANPQPKKARAKAPKVVKAQDPAPEPAPQ